MATADQRGATGMEQVLVSAVEPPVSSPLQGLSAPLLRRALDASTIVVVTVAAGIISDCNKRFVDVSGYSREELIGQTHSLVNSGIHDRSFFVDLYRTIGSGRIWRGTICNRRKNRTLYWVDTTIVPFLGPRGRPAGYIAIRWEVTDHVLAVQELAVAHEAAKRAAEVRDRFLANMSHEVRTPLNGILGLTSALLRSGVEADTRSRLELILSSGESLRRILDDVLDLSKMQVGEMSLVTDRYNPAREISAAVNLIRGVAEERALRLSISIDPTLPGEILGDAVRVRQIVTNLISNAVKFTTHGGVKVQIVVRGPTSDPWLKVRVQDTGPGFDRKVAETLFKPFVQADDSHTRVCGGTGLGLAISRELAELMGGRLDCRARPGSGAVFVLSLPMHRAPEKTGASTPSSDTSGAPSDRSLRVLLVEDNLVNQQVVLALLQPFDIQVEIANNGQEGVASASEGGFDLIFMDMQMPVMDGLCATRRLRDKEKADGAKPTPIIMLTANASGQHRLDALQAGADLVLAKPFTAEQLLSVVWAYGDGASSAAA
ncbi:MAG: ATP-binding protein [Brevundimonas sp.]|uniref:ATP-binding protein n=1 Tax=Brevundimonas sp. TaxID=1871086 RepID=UPI0040343E03